MIVPKRGAMVGSMGCTFPIEELQTDRQRDRQTDRQRERERERAKERERERKRERDQLQSGRTVGRVG